MRCEYACGTAEHTVSRRSFLGGLAAGSMAAGLGELLHGHAGGRRAVASRRQKRILNIFLHGGVSQLETWDPKPNTDTGGPFRAIPTSVPGIHICELLPHTAKQMHRLAIVRSLNTQEQRSRQRPGRDDDRPQPHARAPISAPRRGRRQGAHARERFRCRGTF